MLSCTQSAYVWKDPPINTLGVEVGGECMTQDNLKLVHKKLQAVLRGWKPFGLTLMGRVLVVNTLVESPFTYKLAVLSDLNPPELKLSQDAIWKFIWGRETCKNVVSAVKMY